MIYNWKPNKVIRFDQVRVGNASDARWRALYELDPETRTAESVKADSLRVHEWEQERQARIQKELSDRNKQG